MYKFVANVKEYTLLESVYGTYQITKNSRPIAHPSTEEDAWERIRILSGIVNPKPKCWTGCSLHNCIDCERYYD